MAVQQKQHESIIPYIQISRKLLACDTIQLKAFSEQMSQKYPEMWVKIILEGIHKSNIPHQVILNLLPQEDELNIDDSITSSEIISHQQVNFLQIPESIKIHTFNFLHIEDLINVQHTCRCLCVASRNPNAVYELFDLKISNTYYWSHEWLSKIKILMINNDQDLSDFYFGNVQTLYTTNLFFKIPINFDNLLKLYINIFTWTNAIWKGLIRCVNLEFLHMIVEERHTSDEEELSRDIDLMNNPFRKLRDIQFEAYDYIPSLFLTWLLQCGHNCMLKWEHDISFVVEQNYFGGENKTMCHKAISNLNVLDLTWRERDQHNFNRLMNNLSDALFMMHSSGNPKILEKIKIEIENPSGEEFDVLHRLLKYCHNSELCLCIDGFTHSSDVFLKFMDLKGMKIEVHYNVWDESEEITWKDLLKWHQTWISPFKKKNIILSVSFGEKYKDKIDVILNSLGGYYTKKKFEKLQLINF